MDQVHITLPCKIKRVVRFARQTSAGCSQALVANGTKKLLNYERMHSQNCTARKSLFQWLSPPEGIRIAVGTHIAMRPPHKTGRAAFPHPAPTSGV
jgi:hypothetical protein